MKMNFLQKNQHFIQKLFLMAARKSTVIQRFTKNIPVVKTNKKTKKISGFSTKLTEIIISSKEQEPFDRKILTNWKFENSNEMKF